MPSFEFDESCLQDEEVLYEKLVGLCSMIISRHFYANQSEREDLISTGVLKALTMIEAGYWKPEKGTLMSLLYTGIRNEMHNYLYRISREVLYDDYYEDSYTHDDLGETNSLHIEFFIIDEVCSSFNLGVDIRKLVVEEIKHYGFSVVEEPDALEIDSRVYDIYTEDFISELIKRVCGAVLWKRQELCL